MPRSKLGFYEYMMQVADVVSNRYGKHGLAEKLRDMARPSMGIDPSIAELLDTDIDDIGTDSDQAQAAND
jgi:hypothetical protein